MLPLFTIPTKDRISVLNKIDIVQLSRLRRSCKGADRFIDEHCASICAKCDQELWIMVDFWGRRGFYGMDLPETSVERNDMVTFKENLIFRTDRALHGYHPKRYHVCDDPIRELQCAKFKEIVVNLTTSEWEIAVDGLPREMKLHCKSLRLNSSHATKNLWTLLRTQIACCDDVSIFLSDLETLISIPKFCSNVEVLHMTDDIPDLRVLNRFHSAYIRYNGTNRKNTKFEIQETFIRYLNSLSTTGTGHLESLRLFTACTSVDEQLPNGLATKLYTHRSVSESFTVYFLVIDREKSALIHVSNHYRHVRVIQSGQDNLIIETFNAEKNLMPEPFTDTTLAMVPYDFSLLYDKLRCSDPCDYFAIITETVEETVERYDARRR